MIVAFGNPVYDYIKTPLVTTGTRVLSGCSTNGCLALSRLGHETALVGRIGADYHDRFMADLRKYGIMPLFGLCEETGGFSLIYDARGDRTLDVLGLAAAIEHVPSLCARAQALIIGPILQETPPALIERIAAAGPAPLFLDPQGLLRRFAADGRITHFCPPELLHVATRCHVIKANELEIGRAH